ncbi:MAG: HdeD family acid-resistance protein [Acutalibacteraceae bacterium]
MRSVTPIRAAKISYIITSAAFCLLGIILIVMPVFSISVLGIIVGCALIVFGVVKLAGYFSKDLFRLAFQYDLAFGIMLILLGIIVLIKPHDIMNFLSVLLGISVLADGLFKIQTAIDSRSFGIKKWWLIMLFAVITSITGLLLLFRPEVGSRTVIVFLGIAILFEGILNLCVAATSVKIIRHQRPDVIEVEYYEERKNR